MYNVRADNPTMGEKRMAQQRPVDDAALSRALIGLGGLLLLANPPAPPPRKPIQCFTSANLRTTTCY